jgi:hypothetical protein
MAPPEDTFSMSVMMIPKDVQTDNCGQAFPVEGLFGLVTSWVFSIPPFQ